MQQHHYGEPLWGPYHQPYPSVPAPAYYGPYEQRLPPIRYSPYPKAPPPNPYQTYPPADYDRPYGRAVPLPELSQQELPNLTQRPLQPPQTPNSARSPTSVESGGHVTPVNSKECPDKTEGMTEKQLKKYHADQKRKERNRIAQQKARERQKDAIKHLTTELEKSKKENEQLQKEMRKLIQQVNEYHMQSNGIFQTDIQNSPYYPNCDTH